MTEFDPGTFAATPASKEAFLRQYVPQEDDEGVIATFEIVQEFKPWKTQQAKEKDPEAEDIFEPVEYVRIRVKGNDKLEVHQPATEQHKRRFAATYAQFKAGMDQQRPGTHISKLPGLSPSLVPGFIAKNILTIEDLAEVNDNNLQNLGVGARDMRHLAQRWVKEVGSVQKVRDENADLRATLAQLQARLDQLEKVKSLEAAGYETLKVDPADVIPAAKYVARRPGRPKAAPKVPLVE